MQLTGVLVPMITPFDASGAVALPALERLAHEVLEAGAAGLVGLGTTGEPSSLTPGEQQAVLAVLSRVATAHHVPLLAGGPVSAPPRGAVSASVGSAVSAPADAGLSVVPPFVRPGPDGVVAHFTALSETSPVPLVIYHVPARTGQVLDAGTLRRIGSLDRVIGIKYATGSLDPDAVALLADPPPGFAILAGDDALLSPMLALGAAGGITASAHLATDRFAALAAAWQTGDLDTARKLGHLLAPLSAALFAEPNPSVIKAVLHAQGRIPTPSVRLPLLPATPESRARAVSLLPD
ncbi:dihydrodipicolinate synthase [Actinoplanes sp. SE50]|uniref:dihydrodipicolinate synthase family protein n=1 Tax=unclassified Actinoplanes TaxID=2626549 RepID=UPI00023EC0FE|nr:MULTISPECIES: dihydrodipicolinate synthase family protein [unclassified Actinoplanes]AEV85181.1 dihydrodipicolinate synthase [Actinoplanes sp. SE50/110]ATO83576.1 dihydrodipicolinate synthase [Actinoplanes sp. SE50]SLM00983.1 dihydrodipicolinate synthase [Actinoplanes sp. SE50/110]